MASLWPWVFPSYQVAPPSVLVKRAFTLVDFDMEIMASVTELNVRGNSDKVRKMPTFYQVNFYF